MVVPDPIVVRTPKREIELDRPGLGLAGPLEITGKNLEVHAENATIVTEENEVRIIPR